MKYKKVSIIVPVYNEVESVDVFLARLSRAFDKSNLIYEVIFVDDNSTDGTFEKIQGLLKSANKGNRKKISLYRKKGRKGKAFSLIEGFKKANGGIVAMIDGDLQYPPEAIPLMANELEKADIVVADRKNHEGEILRRIFSKTFRFAFGKLLFGLNHDVQSGLKVMTREVIESVQFMPGSPWTFDLEFLHRARQAGFVIKNFNISFARRKSGISKITFIKTTFEIGINALSVRRKSIHPIHIRPRNKDLMLGAGIGYKRKKYITHTTMPYHSTAINTLSLDQKIVLLLIVLEIVVGFIFHPLLTLQIIVGVLSFIYFVDVLFNLFLTMKSLSFPQEIEASLSDLARINEKKLPIYTILCPLYREVRVIPQFLNSIDKLSWPKDKLDVILLLEEDDKETIREVRKMNLPSYIRTLIVPHSIPKTKPKACNYGLSHARGEYLVIYDAEDMPEAMQLKKAYLGFQRVDKDIICLQAKLNYYNPHQNLLTRFFTAEYSLWFDITLPGLQSINTTIPLGGTSNHFKLKSLIGVEGWDPFNVTEDADLGMRLFKKGYRTAIINSTTLEEANSNIRNWLRQRSRWIKGYMQTYLVHVREAFKFSKNKGRHSLIFQLVIGGKIAFILINPLLWFATLAYFTLYAYVGSAIESVYPSIIFYMAATSLIFGNFLFLYYYMIGVAKRGQWNLMKFVLLIPFYWLMISTAAFVALYQLILKPHYWEKTVHGFHLSIDNKKVVADAVFGVEETSSGFSLPWDLRNRLRAFVVSRKTYIGGIILIVTSVIANFLNFLFNAYLGRVLEFQDFATIGLIGGLLSLASIMFGAFSTTANFRSGFLIGKYGDRTAYDFWQNLRKRAIFFSIIITALWIFLTPLLMSYFNNSNPFLFVSFGLILLVGLVIGADRGYLYSRLKFGSVAIVNTFDPVVKLIAAFMFVYFGLKAWTYLSVPLAILGTFFVGWNLSKKNIPTKKQEVTEEIKKFPKKFFTFSTLSGFSSVFLLTGDILLANHFLSQSEAGQYTLLSLVGKMVFFSGSLISPFMTPIISRLEGANKSSIKTLYLSLLFTTVFSLGGFLIFGLFGRLTIPFLYGEKALTIVPYLGFFTLGMTFYTISRVFVNYYLVKRIYTFIVATSVLSLVQVVLIYLQHESVVAIAFDMTIIWGLHLFLTTVLHFGIKYVRIFENNFIDLVKLFSRDTYSKDNKLNILIFNWRDTKHKWAGGAETYIHELAKRWIKDGNSVSIFSGKGGQKSINEKIDGVQIYRRGGFYTVYIWAFLYYIFKFRGKFDVIIDSENGIPFFTPLYAREKKFLLIHHVHQEVFRKSLISPLALLASVLETKLMPLVYRNVQVITVSPSSKDEILKHRLTKSEPIIIYNGVDFTKFKPGERSKKPVILYLGRLQYYKSLNIFIRAAKSVIDKIPDVEFVIAGEGEEKQNLQKLAEELGLQKYIKFLGKVSESQKIALFQSAWLFVNPSFMEGWGITTIEANACGTPAIASNVPGLRDSVNNPHTGILVPYGNVEGFADAIKSLIKDENLRKEMSKDAIKWSSQFEWGKSAGLFYEFMLKAINKKSSADLGIDSGSKI
ncbi:MAG: glycosyltransferase [Candidatus Levybacteria bacterium]|nr:glycosyltransferase [Candidatus Levybacteria bacterium]